jgi:hypothetical protein
MYNRYRYYYGTVYYLWNGATQIPTVKIMFVVRVVTRISHLNENGPRYTGGFVDALSAIGAVETS